MDPKPNFTYTDSRSTYNIYMDLETGVITDTDSGHEFFHTRSNPFWDGMTFSPIVDETSGAAEDNVNNPSHYGQGKIEAIDYIEDFLNEEEFIGYLRGNIAKYLHRWRWKGKPKEDLEKANWYLARLRGVVKSEGV